MARRPPHPCGSPGCAAVVSGSYYCLVHRRIAQARADVVRPSSSKRGYGTARWARLRAMVLARQPVCPCGQAASEVDHVVSLAHGGTNAVENLEGLCRICHSRKTALESVHGKPAPRPLPAGACDCGASMGAGQRVCATCGRVRTDGGGAG